MEQSIFAWLDWSNPVALWWIFLVGVSVINISAFIFTRKYLREKGGANTDKSYVKVMLVLCSLYVFVCAFRSIIPRADVQRICLFDTWLSSVLLGRSVATIGELAFVAQWALMLHRVAILAKVPSVQKLSRLIVPMIFIAECFSWYAVVSTNYLGNTCEESIWAITYTLIGICLVLLWPKFKGSMRYVIGLAALGCLLYITFMINVDIAMYYHRLMRDMQEGKALLGLVDGFHDLNTRWVVSHDINDWKTEIPWMSLYFSVAVWASLGLCYVPHTPQKLQPHLKD